MRGFLFRLLNRLRLPGFADRFAPLTPESLCRKFLERAWRDARPR